MTEGAGRIAESRTEAPPLAPTGEVNEPTRCLNCDTAFTGRFCPACGQPATDPDPTLREYLHELAAEFLLWDGKLFTTFRLLVARPGELTREFLAGRRVRFISPLRLYLTCSVLYFFLRAVAPEPIVVVRTGPAVKTQVGGVVVREEQEGDALVELDRMARSEKPFSRLVGRRLGNALRHGGEFTAAVRENTPRMMFVLVPFFAALVAIIFRSRRMHYPQHLTFALHVHAFLFLALVPTLVPRLVRGKPYEVPLSVVAVAGSFLAIAVHLVLALRRVYGGTTAGTVARSAVLAGVYFAAFTIALLVTVAIVMAVRF
ncbi:MAG: DUF3667 domain-containing protein [Gemmatimonadaceae bacterium]